MKIKKKNCIKAKEILEIYKSTQDVISKKLPHITTEVYPSY